VYSCQSMPNDIAAVVRRFTWPLQTPTSMTALAALLANGKEAHEKEVAYR
jgi:hypothetical protein